MHTQGEREVYLYSSSLVKTLEVSNPFVPLFILILTYAQ